MFIRSGDPLCPRRRYNLYRLFLVAWILVFIWAVALWNRSGIYFKIAVSVLLSVTLPDGLSDLIRSYETYKRDWEAVNKDKKPAPKI